VTWAAFKAMDASGTWPGFLIIAASDALTVWGFNTLMILTTGMALTFNVDQGLAFFVTIPFIKRFSYVHDWIDAVKLAFAIRIASFLMGLLLSFLLLGLLAWGASRSFG
jgi:hypothetical protein